MEVRRSDVLGERMVTLKGYLSQIWRRRGLAIGYLKRAFQAEKMPETGVCLECEKIIKEISLAGAE